MSWLLRILGISGAEHASSITSFVARSMSGPPVWLWAGILLVGLVLTALNFAPKLSIPRRARVLLGLLRILGVLVLLIVVFQTQLRLGLGLELRPKVALLIDRSGSMQVKDENDDTRLTAAERVQGELTRTLGREVEFVPLNFSNELGSKSAGTHTALAASLADALNLNQDFRAVVLLTDGRDTDARPLTQPAALAAKLGRPVHSVVFGSKEAAKLDYELTLEAANECIRLGDTVSFSGTVAAPGADGGKVQVALLVDGSVAITRDFAVGRGRARFSFEHRPTKARRYRYETRISGLTSDPAPQNNSATHLVDVVDRPIRVLYLEHYPRFENKFLMQALEADPGVQLVSVLRTPGGGWYVKGKACHKDPESGIPASADELFLYEVIILGDLPRKTFSEDGDRTETRLRNVADFVTRRGGGLVTLGGQQVYVAGNYGDSPLAEILPFDLQPAKEKQLSGRFFMDVPSAALEHPIMRIGPDRTKSDELWKEMVQLDGCDAVGNVRPAATLLGTREMEKKRVPVLAVMKVGRGHVLSAAFDTGWRWQLARTTKESSFRTFWGNAIRFLAPDPRREPNQPTIEAYGGRPAVGDTLHLASELLDDFYQPVSKAPLEAHVTRPSGQVVRHYPSDIPEAPGLYEYDIQLPEPGEYKVETYYLGKKRSDRTFEVRPQADEFLDVSPDATALRELAEATGGVSVRPDELDKLMAAIDVTPEHAQELAVVPLWNHPLTLLAFILVVCLDCLVRKRGGLA